MNNIITVKSPANIAFIKYWGQRDQKFILPFNDSFSMNLSNCFTMLQMKIHHDKKKKFLYVKDYQSKKFQKAEGETLEKVIKFYRVTKEFLSVKSDYGFEIFSSNSFPKKAGIASSASFFSALALAFSKGFGKTISRRELSILSRLSGSGSACRSIPDGYSWWRRGKDSQTSYAIQFAPSSFWGLADLVLILNREEKKTSSIEGHRGVLSSHLFKYRLLGLKKRIGEIKKAFLEKKFSNFGKLIEEETISMHSVIMTQNPQFCYWSGKTVSIIKKTLSLRHGGIEAYYTIDAGENVHIICQKKDVPRIYNYFIQQPEVIETIINYPAEGTRLAAEN